MKLILGTCAIACIGYFANLPEHVQPSSPAPAVQALFDEGDGDEEEFPIDDLDVEYDDEGNIVWFEIEGEGEMPIAPAVLDCGAGTPAFIAIIQGTGADPVSKEEAAKRAYRDAQAKLIANAKFICTFCPVPEACKRGTATTHGNWRINVMPKLGGGWDATASYMGAYIGTCSPCPM